MRTPHRPRGLDLPRPALRLPSLPRPSLRRPSLPLVVGTSALAVLITSSATAYTHDDPQPRAEAAMGDFLTPLAPMTEDLVFGAEPAPDVVVTTDAGQQGPSVISTPITLGPLAQRTEPDVVVTRRDTFSQRAVLAMARLAKDGKAVPFRAGSVSVAGRIVPAAGVDPARFRQFAAKGTAEATAVWQAVARGEAVASHAAAKQLGLVLGDTLQVRPVGGGAPVPIRLGALATTGIPSTEIMVDEGISDALRLPSATGLVLAAGEDDDPVVLANALRKLTGERAEVEVLGQKMMTNPTAFLTGGDAARAFGAFNYRYSSDGRIEPDPVWVQDNIRTESVPIFGNVTCHRLMLPQLRGALAEVVASGLGDKLKVYSGCYVPRFIGSDPNRPISLHTWGIAIDFDAATNYRGIRGTMDYGVVQIFKRWGFRWGGDWSYTDPMHFELGAILTSPPR